MSSGEDIPVDSWCEVLTYLQHFSDFRNLCLVVRGLYDHVVQKSNVQCFCEFVYFPLSFLRFDLVRAEDHLEKIKDRKIHVRCGFIHFKPDRKSPLLPSAKLRDELQRVLPNLRTVKLFFDPSASLSESDIVITPPQFITKFEIMSNKEIVNVEYAENLRTLIIKFQFSDNHSWKEQRTRFSIDPKYSETLEELDVELSEGVECKKFKGSDKEICLGDFKNLRRIRINNLKTSSSGFSKTTSSESQFESKLEEIDINYHPAFCETKSIDYFSTEFIMDENSMERGRINHIPSTSSFFQFTRIDGPSTLRKLRTQYGDHLMFESVSQLEELSLSNCNFRRFQNFEELSSFWKKLPLLCFRYKLKKMKIDARPIRKIEEFRNEVERTRKHYSHEEFKIEIKGYPCLTQFEYLEGEEKEEETVMNDGKEIDEEDSVESSNKLRLFVFRDLPKLRIVKVASDRKFMFFNTPCLDILKLRNGSILEVSHAPPCPDKEGEDGPIPSDPLDSIVEEEVEVEEFPFRLSSLTLQETTLYDQFIFANLLKDLTELNISHYHKHHTLDRKKRTISSPVKVRMSNLTHKPFLHHSVMKKLKILTIDRTDLQEIKGFESLETLTLGEYNVKKITDCPRLEHIKIWYGMELQDMLLISGEMRLENLPVIEFVILEHRVKKLYINRCNEDVKIAVMNRMMNKEMSPDFIDICEEDSSSSSSTSKTVKSSRKREEEEVEGEEEEDEDIGTPVIMPKVRRVKCENCFEPVKTVDYIRHLIDCKTIIHKCDKCHKTMKIEDKDSHFEEIHKKVPCKFCNDLYEKSVVENHMKNDCPLRIIKCQYYGCDVAYKERIEHERRCGAKTEKCEKCGELVYRRAKEIHSVSCLYGGTTKDPGFDTKERAHDLILCPFCGIDVFTESGLVSHVFNYHAQDTSNVMCPICKSWHGPFYHHICRVHIK